MASSVKIVRVNKVTARPLRRETIVRELKDEKVQGIPIREKVGQQITVRAMITFNTYHKLTDKEVVYIIEEHLKKL